MKKVVLPLLLALIGTGAYAQTKVKTKTSSGKMTHKVTHEVIVEERVVNPGIDQTIVELKPTPSPVSTAGTTAGPEKLGVYAVDDEQGGALVQHVVAGSPADVAGLKAGDVIIKINDHLIGNASELMATMTRYDRGEQVSIFFERSSRPVTAIVKLGAAATGTATVIDDFGPDEAPAFSSSSSYTGELPRTNMYNDERMILPYGKALGVRGIEVNRGIKITAVRLGSPADRAGLHSGDIITRLDGERVWYSNDLDRILRHSGERSLIEFLRHGSLYTTELRY